MHGERDVMDCQWCRGDGKDHATLGLRTMRDCPRCEGSGKVYVSSRESVTGRRRVYKGPAPKPGVMASRQQQELTEALQKPKRAQAHGKPRKKHARRHAA